MTKLFNIFYKERRGVLTTVVTVGHRVGVKEDYAVGVVPIAIAVRAVHQILI